MYIYIEFTSYTPLPPRTYTVAHLHTHTKANIYKHKVFIVSAFQNTINQVLTLHTRTNTHTWCAVFRVIVSAFQHNHAIQNLNPNASSMVSLMMIYNAEMP